MSFYIIIFIILALLSYLAKRNLAVFSACILVLSAIAGLRGMNIGADTHSYYEYFEFMRKTRHGYMEPLWSWLNLLILNIGGNFNVLLFVVSLLTLGIVGYVLWKEIKNPQFGLFLYYALYAFCNSLNGMRQYLAISVVLLAYYFLKNRRNLLLFVCIILMGMWIHHSALLGFLVFPLIYFNFNRWLTVVALVGTFAVGATVFPQIDLSFLYGSYAGYAETGFWVRESPVQAMILALLMDIYMVCILFTSPKNVRENLYFKILLFGILIMNLTFRIEIMARIILYFTIVQIVLIPLYLTDIKAKPLSKLIIEVLMLFYFSSIFFKILILGNSGVYSLYPYVIQIY